MSSNIKLVLLALTVSLSVHSQEVPYHISNVEVYEFIDELASVKAIEVNNAVRPLSRKYISSLLQQAVVNDSLLNKRQKKELAFYRQEFVKETDEYQGLDFLGKGLKSGKVFPLRNRKKRIDLFNYKDSVFGITVNPIVGGTGYISGNKYYYRRQVGARIFGNVTKHVAFYGELRDYSETMPFSNEQFLNQELGANYKKNNEFSEARGGLIGSFKWASIGLVKDHIAWGTAYNGSNIFSGRTPSVPMIKLNLSPNKWFSFDYIHAWLVSDVLDSAASYTTGTVDREVMRSKFLAANMYTVRPVKGLHFSLGNSVVYADKFNPVYLIPFLFYKSADHTFNSTGAGNNFRGQNSQMFLNVVSRQIKYLELYTSLFIDELRLSTIADKKNSRNHFSWKIGTRFTAPGNVNLSLIVEYTRTNPIAFRHFVSTTTFESNGYGLGHYLGDNAEEVHVTLLYKPISRLAIRIGLNVVRKGESYPYNSGSDGSGLPFIVDEQVRRYDGTLAVSYSVAHDLKVAVKYQYLNEFGPEAYAYLPQVYGRNGPHHLSLSVSIGY